MAKKIARVSEMMTIHNLFIEAGWALLNAVSLLAQAQHLDSAACCNLHTDKKNTGKNDRLDERWLNILQ